MVRNLRNTSQKEINLLREVEIQPDGDDQGVIFLHQISVAEEIVAGQDSYPVPLAFHCTENNTTGKVITSATDVTTILKSDTGSSTGLFGDTVAGSYILVASTDIFQGAKLKYNSLALVEPANISAEYYQDDTELWVERAFMGTNGRFPYEAHGWEIAQHTSEHIFFGLDPLQIEEAPLWTPQTFTINGTEYSDLYWARFKINSDITGDPVVEQIKLHTDRIEIERYRMFKFGRARSSFTLNAGIINIVPNTAKTPLNNDVTYTSGIVAGNINNQMAKGKDDGFLMVVNRDSGLDTSIPLIITFSYYVEGTSIGDLLFEISTVQVTDGFNYDGTEVPFETYTQTETVATNIGTKTRRTAQFLVPINALSSSSGIVVSLARLGTDVLDTVTTNIVGTHITVDGYKWKI